MENERSTTPTSKWPAKRAAMVVPFRILLVTPQILLALEICTRDATNKRGDYLLLRHMCTASVRDIMWQQRGARGDVSTEHKADRPQVGR